MGLECVLSRSISKTLKQNSQCKNDIIGQWPKNEKSETNIEFEKKDITGSIQLYITK